MSQRSVTLTLIHSLTRKFESKKMSKSIENVVKCSLIHAENSEKQLCSQNFLTYSSDAMKISVKNRLAKLKLHQL